MAMTMTITSFRFARQPNMKAASNSRKPQTDVKRLKSLKDSAIVIGRDAPARAEKPVQVLQARNNT
jgi:hypothetical protein